MGGGATVADVMSLLEAAISAGNHREAALLAKEVSKMKISQKLNSQESGAPVKASGSQAAQPTPKGSQQNLPATNSAPQASGDKKQAVFGRHNSSVLYPEDMISNEKLFLTFQAPVRRVQERREEP